MRIQTQYTLGLIAFSLAPLAIAIGAGSSWSRTALLVTERSRLETLGTLKASQLRTDLEAHQQLAHRLRREFSQAGLGDLADEQAAARWSEWLRGAAASAGPNTELAVLDLSGSVMAASVASMEGRMLAGAPRIEAGRVEPQTVGPHLRPGEAAAIEDATYEPLTNKSGTTVAELAITGNNAALRDWLFDDLSPGVRAELSTLGGERLGTWPPDSAAPSGADQERVDARLRLADGGALLSLSTREASALGPLVILRRLGLAALLLIALAAVALALLLGRSLARPLDALAAEAGRIGAGDLSPLARPALGDEFAVLWSAMDRMRHELVEAREHVEQLLGERTLALVGQQRLVGSLFEALPDVVLVLDASRRIGAANRTARRLYGDGVEGGACYQVLHGTSAPCPLCPLDEVLAGRPCDGTRISVTGAAREAVAVSLSAVGPAGVATTTALYTGRIVTRERLLQTRLAHQEKMAAVGALAAGVAHEVRNPLASLSSLVQVRLRDASLGERTRVDLGVMLDHVERIDRTVKNLTYAAREPTAGRRPALLQDLVDRVVQLARFDPRAQGVTLETTLDRAAPPLKLDEDAWLQTLLNLVVNALDAVELSPQRRVQLTVARIGAGGVVLSVRDTGCGMSAEVKGRATDPLFTTKPPGRGTGLGLHLVREVVEQHGGQLLIDSSEGAGTTVRITLGSGA